MVIKKRDTRTAQEKWNQGISEARCRGYWNTFQRPVPAGLFGGWDHTKPTNHNIGNFDIVAIQLPSRGFIDPNCRDDTDDEVFVVVTRFGPVTRMGGVTGVDQTTTRRVPCLPARKQTPEEVKGAFERFFIDMAKKREGKVGSDKDGGPRWTEWCIWDDQYLWERYRELGLECTQLREPFNDYSLTDFGYRNVREEMERLASSQKIMSWAQMLRREPVIEKIALYARVRTYLLMSKHMNSGKSRPLPQPWSGRGFHYLNYDIHSEAFVLELRWWTDLLYKFLHPGEDEAENSSQQQLPPSNNLHTFGRKDASPYQEAVPAYQSTGFPVVGNQYYQRSSYDHNAQLPHSRIFRSRHSSQMDHLLPADLLGDED
jgi:hypothetical protein